MQQLGEGRHVQRRGLAVPGEQPVKAQRAEHLIHVGVAERGDAHRDVAGFAVGTADPDTKIRRDYVLAKFATDVEALYS